MNLDEKELEILRHLGPGPAAVKPLLARMPRSSVYRRLKRLAALGLIRREGRRYLLRPSGHQALEDDADRGDSPSDQSKALDRVLPHTRLAPTPFHAALLRLIGCAVVARRHRVRESHHPAFVVFGPKLRWKTWVAKAACLMVGADPAEDVIFLGTESGRSMLSRKSRDGKRLTARKALSRPVVGLDEFLRAKPDVRRLLEVYLFGDVSVPDEDGPITVEPVPIVTLNPRENLANDRLNERLDLDDAMLRRSIVANVGDVPIPDEVLAEGDARLERMRALGPAEFPMPRQPSWDPRHEIREGLVAALSDHDRIADIDISMVAMLACSATAWLSREGAVRTVLIDYLSVVERLGWLKPDWRSEAESARGGRGAHAPATSGASTRANRLLFDAKLHRLADECDRLGLEPLDLGQCLEDLSKLRELGFSIEAARTVACQLDRHGLTPEEAGRLARHLVEGESVDRIERARAERVRRLASEASRLEHRLARLHGLAGQLGDDAPDIAELCKLRDELAACGLPIAELAILARRARKLAGAAGTTANDAAALAGLALESLSVEVGEDDLFAALRAMATGAREVVALSAVEAGTRERLEELRVAEESAEQRLSALCAEVAQSEAVLADRARLTRDARGDVREAKRVLSETRREHHALRADIVFAGELLAFVHGVIGRDPELWRRLGAVFQAVARGFPGPHVSECRRAFRRRLVEHLRRAVADDGERRPERRARR